MILLYPSYELASTRVEVTSMRPATEKLDCVVAAVAEPTSMTGKKRPLAHDGEAINADRGDCMSQKPLKKRWAAMANPTPPTTTSTISRSNCTSDPAVWKTALNPLSLLSEVSETASALEKQGDKLAHYEPRILNNLRTAPQEMLASAPVHIQFKNQLLRRRQMLVGLQHVTAYKQPGFSSADIKLPSWQKETPTIDGLSRPKCTQISAYDALLCAGMTRGGIRSAALMTEQSLRDVKKQENKKEQARNKSAAAAAKNTESAAVEEAPRSGLCKAFEKTAPPVPKVPPTATSTGDASATKKVPSNKTTTPKKTKQAQKKAAKPVREFNYTPLGGRNYCWM